MKKNLLLPLLLFVFLKAEAQITLQHTFDSTAFGGSGNFYCTDIGNNDFKYVFIDAVTNNFSLYNMNMTPYLQNIAIPATGDSISQGFTVIYITKSLFDCDTTNIEYVFEYQWAVTKAFRVYRTDGTLLLQVDSANGPYCGGCYGGSFDVKPIINTSDGAKLFIQKYDPNNVPEILVYSVCGTVPNNIYDFSQNHSYVKIHPNPANLELVFEVIPPNNQEEFELVIFDSIARANNKESILIRQDRFSVDVSRYSNGTYFYSLFSKSKVYQTGKFIITK